jgi:hypothetical protein
MRTKRTLHPKTLRTMEGVRKRKHKVILNYPYPHEPGMMAERIDNTLIGVYTCSETFRKYKLVARLDNTLQVISGPPQFQQFIDKNYNTLRTLKLEPV